MWIDKLPILQVNSIMTERFGNKKKWYRVIYDIKMSNNYDHQKKWDRKMLRIRWDLNIKIINGKSKMKFVLIGTFMKNNIVV